MLAWYQTVLGAEVVHSDGMLAFLTYDTEHHRIAIANIPARRPAADGGGTDHVAFTFADLGDLLYTYARLKAAGIEPYWCINTADDVDVLQGPDGNRVELQVDNYPTAEEANRWMRSGEFAANPIGVVFDPDALLARYRAGEPLATLTAARRCPRVPVRSTCCGSRPRAATTMTPHGPTPSPLPLPRGLAAR